MKENQERIVVGYTSGEYCEGDFVVLKVGNKNDYYNCMKCYDKKGNEVFESNPHSICEGIKNELTVSYDFNGEPLYVYAGNYDNNVLREKLRVNKIARLHDIDDNETYAKYENTNESIYPINITSISLNKETVDVSGKNVGKTVKYSDNKTRNVYVYKFMQPTLEGITGNTINTSGNSDIKLKPTSQQIGKSSWPNASLTPPFSPNSDLEFYDYQYFDSEQWQNLNCNSSNKDNNWSCTINDKIKGLDKTKFRIVGLDTEGKLYYGKETNEFNILSTIKVTFVAPEATKAPSPPSIDVTYGNPYGALATTERTGYEFDGWYTDSIGGTKVESSTTVIATGDHTLYAHWVKSNTYTLTYYLNQIDPAFYQLGGSYTSDDIFLTEEKTYGQQFQVTNNIPTRPGYRFVAWTAYPCRFLCNYQLTMSGELYGDDYYEHETEVLYAIWEEDKPIAGCRYENLSAGVYYVEIVGGGAGGYGFGKSNNRYNYAGGNAARWAGYIYLPEIVSAKICAGDGSDGTNASYQSAPAPGEPSYIADHNGTTRYIEAMGGMNYLSKYSNSITKIETGIEKLMCNNIVGKTQHNNKVTYGYGGVKTTATGLYHEAYSGTMGMIYYKYIKTLNEWNSAPSRCPTTPVCSVSDCGWVNWPTS